MNKIKVAACIVALSIPVFAETILEYPVTGDGTINVPLGTTTRIEYLSGTAAATLTKIGGGTLEVAVIGNTNVSFVVSEGKLKSVRGTFALSKDKVTFRADASMTSSMAFKTSGSSSVTQWNDADGREMFAQLRTATSTAPTLKTGGCNGLNIVDFGGFQGGGNTGVGACFMQLSSTNIMREAFWVWKDQDGTKDIQKADGKSFRGPTPVSFSAVCYRGAGGNGYPFIFSAVGPPSAMNAVATVDGKQISMADDRIDEGWHLATLRLTGKTSTYAASSYGAEAFGRRALNSEYGGFQLAEVVLCAESLSDADFAYVNAYLNNKWFSSAKLRNITVSEGATLDVSDVLWKIERLQISDGEGVVGLENLRVMEACFPSNTMLSAGSKYKAIDFLESATPNLSFAANGEIEVASGVARGNIIDANGVLTKSGEGGFETSYLTEGVTSISVIGGSFTLSPLLSAESVLHFDAAQFVTTTESNGKALVTNWGDVNVGRGSSLGRLDGNYKFKSSPVNLPYLVENATAVGLPLVDFGSFADQKHPDGWGAALLPTKPLTGGKNAWATNNGWLQGFVVWQDDDATKDLDLVDGDTFVGPCLFGVNASWTRGKGGGGRGFPLSSGGSSDFTTNLRFDGKIMSPIEAKNNPVPSGLHLFDSEPGTVDGMSGVVMVGAKREAANTAYFGGVKFGEFMFFRHRIPAGQRAKIAAALGVKWFGANNYKLEHEFDFVGVSDGASASFPYANVKVSGLAVTGTIAAQSIAVKNLTVTDGEIAASLVMNDGGTITVTESNGEIPCLTAQSVSFAGKGTIALTAPSVGDSIVKPIKVIAAANGPEHPQKVNGWRSVSGVKVALVRRADGYYIEQNPGLMVIVK